jgi:hypothetical protein
MAPLKDGFDPERRDSRWTELAREALAERRDILAGIDPRNLLKQIRENPMLVLLGAQMLLLRPEPDLGLLREAANLLKEKGLDTHPDLLALDALLDEKRADLPPYLTPPMLRGSWKTVVRASAKRPELIPAQALAARIADRIVGVGPWLIWRYSEDLDAIGSPVSIPVGEPRPKPILDLPATSADLSSALYKVAERVITWLPDITFASREVVESKIREAGWSRSESGLLNYLLQVGQQIRSNASQEKSSTERTGEDPLSSESFVRGMMMPASVLGEAVNSLMAKVKEDSQSLTDQAPSVWPEPDPTQFIYSSRFGQLMLDLAGAFIDRFPGKDFTDAVSQVFGWLDAKLKEEPNFINADRFPTRDSFLAYVSQALWNAVNMVGREGERRDRQGLLPLDRPLETHGSTPQEAALLSGRLEALPEPQRTVVERILFDQGSLEDAARAIGQTADKVADLFEQAISFLSDGLSGRPMPSAERTKQEAK